ncbi:alpha/beta hydrolase [Erythrobacter sp. SCSIO 43205]|uniref:alpha/beta fold hydrolase n=1 Tax=Erythrobacter sp. SCSIO 43205 TaxID=2779361 RepID=UPI001CA9620C|nr:alpha/beta hydrolase [Erythrobacter sp. SCSIO 43205]UAB78336.1 alpha/beta hydrolase [Erythrobacter sp. SCSIO 43205]
MLVIASLSVNGCAGLGYLGSAVLSPPQKVMVQSEGFGELELYSFDTGPSPSQAIFFISGSGCASLRFFLKRYFTGLPEGYRIYALQKSGVDAMNTGANCSDQFHRSNTIDQLIARNGAALTAVKAQFGGEFVAIVGVSEGGVVSAPVAVANPQIPNLIIIGAGAMTFREELSILARQRGREDELTAALANVEITPKSIDERFMGMPHLYLTSMLDFDPLPHLLASKQRVLFVHGEKDESVPLASARVAAEALSRDSSRKVVLEIVPGANHVLVNEEGDQKVDIMRKLPVWMNVADQGALQ